MTDDSKRELVGLNDLADMLLNGAAEQTWPRKIGAEAWFGFRNCDRYEVEEQSFMLRGDEVLTVLNIPASGLG